VLASARAEVARRLRARNLASRLALLGAPTASVDAA
jgi:hypothetical protein